jgi:hypothetical protein
MLTIDPIDKNEITFIQDDTDEEVVVNADSESESGNPFSVLKVDPNEVTFIEDGVDVEVALEQNDGKSCLSNILDQDEVDELSDESGIVSLD